MITNKYETKLLEIIKKFEEFNYKYLERLEILEREYKHNNSIDEIKRNFINIQKEEELLLNNMNKIKKEKEENYQLL